MYPALHRPATFIETALRNLRNALALGAVLIVIVLFAFLRDWRSALISFLAIPLSLFAAVAVFAHFGMALNTLTLGGFAVALGVLVDDAVIYLENILRRLRENAAAAAAARAARGDPRCLGGNLRQRGVRHRRHPAGVHAGVPVVGRAGPLHDAAGAGVLAVGAGLAAGGAHRDAGAGRAAVARRRERGPSRAGCCGCARRTSARSTACTRAGRD